MPRNDIWRAGINTRFSAENQPPGRGRPKGQRNRRTILRAFTRWYDEVEQAFNQERRDHRNAQRRERYRAKKWAGGTVFNQNTTRTII